MNESVSQSRRLRQYAQRERAILEAAKEIATRQGWTQVTMRKLADAIEYTVPTVYEHFESKEALLHALLCLGFGQIAERLAQAAGQEVDPLRRLLALADAAWQFAADEPALYQVMHGLGGVPFGTQDSPAEARAAFALLREHLLALARSRRRRLTDPDDLVDALWALVHGFISLSLAGRIAGGPPRARRLMEAAIYNLLTAWRLVDG
jgi:AcrR family transcriptional regulator